jgi:hypothetical protein
MHVADCDRFVAAGVGHAARRRVVFVVEDGVETAQSLGGGAGCPPRALVVMMLLLLLLLGC